MRHTIRVAKDDDGRDGQRWAKELVERVGKAIKDARGGRSAAWLSDKTAELGYRVSPTVIAKLDSGHRGSVLSVPELLVLAAALDAAPVTLMYPSPYGREVELLPGENVSAFVAAQWFSGLYDHVPPAPGANFYDYRQNLAALRGVRTLDELRSRKALLLSIIASLGGSAEDTAVSGVLTGQLTDIEAVIKRYEQDDDA
jgi:hypothetical protein